MNRHHNMPPLAERLELDHASLAAEVEAVKALPALAPIFGDDDLAEYSERAKTLKQVVGQIEKARKAEKDSILRDGRTVDDFFKALAKPVSDLADLIVAAINAHQRKMLEAQRKAAAEQAEREREAAKVFNEPAPAPAPVVQAREAARVVSSAGRVVAAARTVWRHRVVNLDAVPRQYLMVNEAAIKAAIAAGVREIPGVEVYEDVQTAIR